MAVIENKVFKLLPICHDRCCSNLIKALIVLLLIYPVHEYYYFQLEFTNWDLLLFSGIATFILGLHLARGMPVRFRECITRLENRQVFEFGNMSLEDLFEEINKKGDFWARIIGLIAALGIALAFIDVFLKDYYWPRIFLGIAEAFGAYIAGNYLGRMASYGQLGGMLKSYDITIKVDPSHIDGVGGLKPVGDFYFYQAMVVAIPAIYLGVWWFLFPLWPRDYSYWEESYLGLMAIAFSIEILAFLLPLWSFHVIMLEKKYDWQCKADDICNEISELQNALDTNVTEDEKKNKLAQIEEKTQRYWAIENMVTWPADIRTRHRFRFNNILLLIPLVGDIVKRHVELSKLVDLMRKLSG